MSVTTSGAAKAETLIRSPANKSGRFMNTGNEVQAPQSQAVENARSDRHLVVCQPQSQCYDRPRSRRPWPGPKFRTGHAHLLSAGLQVGSLVLWACPPE